MNMPGFRADASLYDGATYHAGAHARAPLAGSRAGAVVPALPYCGNCPGILDRCYSNGWRPAGLCNLCYYGNCYTQPFPS
jgi:hypothetical protein